MRPLTPRELVIVSLVAEGKRNKDIASELGITEDDVKNRLHSVFDKLGMWNRTEVALWYVKHTFKGESA